MKFALGIKVNTVVATTHPISIVIDQRDIERKKFQCTIDVKNWLELFRKLIDRSLVEDFAKLYQRIP